MAVYNSPTPTSPAPTVEGTRSSPVRGGFLGIVFGVLALLYVAYFTLVAVGQAADGDLQTTILAITSGDIGAFITASVQTIPFALLAVLAYLGIDYLWARITSLLYLLALIGSFLFLAVGTGLAVLADIQMNGAAAAPGDLGLDGADVTRVLIIFGISIAAIAISALGFIPAVRRAISRVLPINPDSFVHTVALVAVVSITALTFIPLIVLGSPPLLELVNRAKESGTDLTAGQDTGAQLRTTVYGLVWTVPGTIIAVGYAVRRNLRDALERLGFVRPTIKQVVIGIVAAVALVALVQAVGLGIQSLWQAMGWPETDGEAFSELMAFAFSPLGAVVIGVTAGLGEELAVRGVLQPRLGILLSNLFFTGLHAFQYNWDSLLIVFTVGMALGLIRKRTNTTTSAITHGVYNFLLIIGTVLERPGFTE